MCLSIELNWLLMKPPMEKKCTLNSLYFLNYPFSCSTVVDTICWHLHCKNFILHIRLLNHYGTNYRQEYKR